MTELEVKHKISSLRKTNARVMDSRYIYFSDILSKYSDLSYIDQIGANKDKEASLDTVRNLRYFAIEVESIASKCREYSYKKYRTLCELFNSPFIIEGIVKSPFNTVMDALILYIRKKKVTLNIINLSRSLLVHDWTGHNSLLEEQEFSDKHNGIPIDAVKLFMGVLIASVVIYFNKYVITYTVQHNGYKFTRNQCKIADAISDIGNIIADIGLVKVYDLMNYDVNNHNQWPFVGNAIDFAYEQLRKMVPNNYQISKMHLLNATSFRGINQTELIRLNTALEVVTKLRNRDYPRYS